MIWPELTAAVDEFRAVRERTLAIANGISDELARRQVRTGTWSAGEVLDHIVRAESAFRGYQRLAVERARAGGSGAIRIGFDEVDTRLRPLSLRWMKRLGPVMAGLHAVTPFRMRLAVMRRPGFVWAVAPRVATPGEARGIEELRADLTAGVRETEELFGGEMPEMLRAVRVSHPLYGSSNVWQMVRLMGAHEERHQRQIRAIL